MSYDVLALLSVNVYLWAVPGVLLAMLSTVIGSVSLLLQSDWLSSVTEEHCDWLAILFCVCCYWPFPVSVNHCDLPYPVCAEHCDWPSLV